MAAKGARFTSISAAVAAANKLKPSATNPILIKLAPGRYQLEDLISIRSFVTLEGSGAGTSIVSVKGLGLLTLETSSIVRRMTIEVSEVISQPTPLFIAAGASDVRVEDTDFTASVATMRPEMLVTQGTNAVLRRITFKNPAPSTGATGIAVVGGSALIEGANVNLTGEVTGILATLGATATVRNSVITQPRPVEFTSVIGIRATNEGTTLEVENVRVTILGAADGGTVALWSSNRPRIAARNSTFAVTGFTYGTVQVDEAGTLEILNSDIIADSSNRPAGAYSGGSLSIGSSRVSGGPVHTEGGGTARCAGVSDEDFVFSASTCP